MESTDKFERRLTLVWSFFFERGFGKDDLQGGGRELKVVFMVNKSIMWIIFKLFQN